MAGPGGGPPRKSHTKSRKGCKTCKKRHIRCDETFPQCRNCTKHNCRCDYMDMPATADEATIGTRPAELLMTPELERELDYWRMTGEPPFPQLRTSSREYWLRFSTQDLRLVQHIAGLSIDIHKRGYASCTVWAEKMPVLLEIALTSDFVMSAILALSASHLAWKTQDSETEHIAFHHHGVALKGLHEAIGTFSKLNSEAILAASMLLSWQATEWRSWASLQQGVSTVMNAMRPWMHESRLASHLSAQRSIGRARTPVTPTYPGSQLHQPPEDLARLDKIVVALHELRARLANSEELSGYIYQLLRFLMDLKNDSPLQAPDVAFERLQQLRSWLFWLPPALFRPHESDHAAFAVLAHFFAVAIALDPLFPEIGGSYLGTMSVAPIEEMRRILIQRMTSNPQDTNAQMALALIEAPVRMVSEYKARQQYQIQQSEAYRASPRSPYAVPSMPLASTPELPPAGLFNNSPMQSPSSLSVPTTPYFQTQPHGRSMSQYTSSTPGLRAQTMGERSMSFNSPLGSSATTLAYHDRGFNSDDQMASGGGFHRETDTAFQPYGANTGFVTPEQIWT